MSRDMSSLNIAATLNVFRVMARPGLCLPHATVATFNDVPVPLEGAFAGRRRGRDGGDGGTAGPGVSIRAVVLDKDDCFARPQENEVWKPYQERFSLLRQHYPGRRLLIVSNTAGSTSSDPDASLARTLSANTGVAVLTHSVKKPGCAREIMDYFRNTDEREGLRDITADQIAVVGDRLLTDMCLANEMGSWGVWVKDGVVPLEQKSVFARLERNIAAFLMRKGCEPPTPQSLFE